MLIPKVSILSEQIIGLTVTWGLIVYLPMATWCKASVTPIGLKTEEKSGRRRTNHVLDKGIQVIAITDCHKTETRVTILGLQELVS